MLLHTGFQECAIGVGQQLCWCVQNGVDLEGKSPDWTGKRILLKEIEKPKRKHLIRQSGRAARRNGIKKGLCAVGYVFMP